MKKVLALFDFDGTVIRGNSLLRFLWYFNGPFVFIKNSFLLSMVLVRYAGGRIDSQFAKEKVYSCFFAGINRKDFIDAAAVFSLSVIPLLVKEKTIERLKWHQKMNHDCILVSASIEEYLLPWAENIGFSKVIASRLEVDGNGKITGRLLGKNCKGYEKIRRIEEYLGDLKHYETYVYGDSEGDKELLEISDHPFYRSYDTERPYPT